MNLYTQNPILKIVGVQKKLYTVRYSSSGLEIFPPRTCIFNL